MNILQSCLSLFLVYLRFSSLFSFCLHVPLCLCYRPNELMFSLEKFFLCIKLIDVSFRFPSFFLSSCISSPPQIYSLYKLPTALCFLLRFLSLFSLAVFIYFSLSLLHTFNFIRHISYTLLFHFSMRSLICNFSLDVSNFLSPMGDTLSLPPLFNI